VVERWVAALPANSPLAFLLLRQAGLADCLLLVVLLLALKSEGGRLVTRSTQSAEADEPQAAA
jgi:hypothetical protein